MQEIANNNSNIMQIQAAAILYFALGTKIDEYTGLPSSGSSERLKAPDIKTQKKFESIKSEFFLRAIPNPASIDVAVSYQLPKEVISGTLQVIDITGRVMYKTEVINSLNQVYINTKEWANGMYYYSLIVNNQVIATKTIIINK